MEPLTGEALEARIKELKEERDVILQTASKERPQHKRYSQYTICKRTYNSRISNLRKYGVENTAQLKEFTDKGVATKRERYGNGLGDMAKFKATKLTKYGNAFGDQQLMCKIKEERYGDPYYNNMQKAQQTKLQKYGYRTWNATKVQQTIREHYPDHSVITAKAQQTKMLRYGNAAGNPLKAVHTRRLRYGDEYGGTAKRMQTNLERYGVPWFVMTEHCRHANGRTITTVNRWWHDFLLQRLNIDCTFDDVNIGRFSYDLHYKHLLIEINPSFSHNAAFGFAYAIGKSKRNLPIPNDRHFRKTQAALAAGYICITIWDWDNPDDVIEIIRQHLCNEHVDSTDLSKNPVICNDKSTIRKHWWNYKKRLYVVHTTEVDEQQLLDAGYVPVYDCGHAVQK